MIYSVAPSGAVRRGAASLSLLAYFALLYAAMPRLLYDYARFRYCLDGRCSDARLAAPTFHAAPMDREVLRFARR